MAQEDLEIKLKYDIAEAERKADKFNNAIETTEKKVKNAREEIEKTDARLIENEKQRKAIEEQILQVSKEINKFESGTSAIGKKTYDKKVKERDALIKQRDNTVKQIEREEKAQSSQELNLLKQKNHLEDVNAQYTNQMLKVDRLKRKQKELTAGTLGTKEAVAGMSKSFVAFEKRVIRLAKRVFIFSVLTKAFRALRKEIGETIKENKAMNEYLQQTKLNLSVIGKTLFQSFQPFLEWLLWAVSRITNLIAIVLTRALGKDLKTMQKMALKSKEIEKSAKNATASFDTLQTIDTSGGSQSGGGGLSPTIAEQTEEEIQKIMALASVSMLAIGLILLFSGNPLGLACLALGVSLLVKEVIPVLGGPTSEIKAQLAEIMYIAGLSLMALGLILIMFQQYPIGIGLMIAGAVAFATAVGTDRGAITEDVKEGLNILMGVATGAFLVIGLILCLAGPHFLPLGIACIMVGLAGLITAVAVNWDFLVDWFTEQFAKIKSKFKDFLNWVIGKINAISFTVPDWVPHLGGKQVGFNIPYLAKGAVIPGGRPFPAMLGDQPAGQTNIETPLETMIEAFKQAQASQTITINFTGSGAEIARMLNPLIQQEQRRATIF